MAAINATRYGETAQKKTSRVMVFELNDDTMKDNGLTVAAGTFDFLVATIPANAVLTAAYVTVRKAANSATTATVAVGTAEGGAQVLAATDIKTVAVAGTIVAKRFTGTGQAIYARVVATGATTSIGDVAVVVEYTELDKNTGEYTVFS